MIETISGLGFGGLLIAIVALAVWILVLVWLAQRVLRFIGLRSGWAPLDGKNMLAAAVLLTGAIHLGNYLLDVLEASMRGSAGAVELSFPGAFLIGSVAIGVGIAAIRWHRQQKRGE
ncbi:hypothetical protein GCM10023115_08190 [Pontixanthobacter gangjinensis]|uniref:Uncharacterized protein n=1 Tax=Pontixanthobacter gangjinensis TaxID=1028742 RepID=A0A6I4SKT6_9SPHN|nr:hypothetical protein [Pontixanthobacter gangjinensis]MXO56068.1 hypothetical protein [Pontixanthobacter gangjinensis]